VRFLLLLISGLHNTRIGLREEVSIQIEQGLALFAVRFDEIVVLKVNELEVEGGCLRMEKGSAFATDTEAILHGLSAGDGDEREGIPSILVIEIMKVAQIEMIQPVQPNGVAGPYSQEHSFFGGSIGNGEINVPSVASEREQGFRLGENKVLWGEGGKCCISTKEIRL